MDKKLIRLLNEFIACVTENNNQKQEQRIVMFDYLKNDGATIDGNEEGLLYLASEIADLIANQKEGSLKKFNLPQLFHKGNLKFMIEKVKDPGEADIIDSKKKKLWFWPF